MDDDEAAFFRRPKKIIETKKRKRGSDRKLPQKAVTSQAQESSSSDSESISSLGSGANPAKTLAQSEVEPTPVVLNLTSESDSNADADQSIDRERPSRPAKVSDTRNKKHIRRSDSLTPPPQMSKEMREAQSILVQGVFQASFRPLDLDFPPDVVEEVDEAQRLFEQQMRERMLNQGRSHDADQDKHDSGQGVLQNGVQDFAAVPQAAPMNFIIELVIKGIYIDIPSSRELIPDIGMWEKSRMLRVRLNSKVSISKIAFCKYAGMCIHQDGQMVVDSINERKHDDIILTYRDVKVYDSVTLYDIGIRDGEQPCMEAHTKQGWKYLLENPTLRPFITMKDGVYTKTNAERSTPDVHAQLQFLAEENGASNKTIIKLTIRAEDGRSLNVRTQASTSISKLIEGFKTKHSLPADQRAALFFEGEELVGIVGDSDVEAGDVIDFRLLNEI